MEKDFINLDISRAIADQVLSNYFSSVRVDLLDGKNVIIPGVGTLVPKVRKVKNDKGRDFSVRVKVIQEKKFSKELLGSYEADPSKFKG